MTSVMHTWINPLGVKLMLFEKTAEGYDMSMPMVAITTRRNNIIYVNHPRQIILTEAVLVYRKAEERRKFNMAELIPTMLLFYGWSCHRGNEANQSRETIDRRQQYFVDVSEITEERLKILNVKAMIP